jgi:large subunit ribosomal protein L35
MADSNLPEFIESRGSSTMPKLKTHKGTKKRFRVTANGKVKHRGAGTSHLNSRMSKKRRRNLRGTDTCDANEAKRIKRLLLGNSY